MDRRSFFDCRFRSVGRPGQEVPGWCHRPYRPRNYGHGLDDGCGAPRGNRSRWPWPMTGDAGLSKARSRVPARSAGMATIARCWRREKEARPGRYRPALARPRVAMVRGRRRSGRAHLPGKALRPRPGDADRMSGGGEARPRKTADSAPDAAARPSCAARRELVLAGEIGRNQEIARRRGKEDAAPAAKTWWFGIPYLRRNAHLPGRPEVGYRIT